MAEMALTLIDAPAVEPISLAEVKNNARIDDDLTEDDALVQSLIVTARMHLDGYAGILGRCLISQTWRLDLPCFETWTEIPLPPLLSVDSVKYYDTDGTLQTVATSVYETILNGTSGGYVHLLSDQSWPSDINTSRAFPVQITFTAGYGGSWNDVPQPIRHAISMMITDWNENRGEMVENTMIENKAVDRLLAPYRGRLV